MSITTSHASRLERSSLSCHPLNPRFVKRIQASLVSPSLTAPHTHPKAVLRSFACVPLSSSVSFLILTKFARCSQPRLFPPSDVGFPLFARERCVGSRFLHCYSVWGPPFSGRRRCLTGATRLWWLRGWHWMRRARFTPRMSMLLSSSNVFAIRMVVGGPCAAAAGAPERDVIGPSRCFPQCHCVCVCVPRCSG